MRKFRTVFVSKWLHSAIIFQHHCAVSLRVQRSATGAEETKRITRSYQNRSKYEKGARQLPRLITSEMDSVVDSLFAVMIDSILPSHTAQDRPLRSRLMIRLQISAPHDFIFILDSGALLILYLG